MLPCIAQRAHAPPNRFLSGLLRNERNRKNTSGPSGNSEFRFTSAQILAALAGVNLAPFLMALRNPSFFGSVITRVPNDGRQWPCDNNSVIVERSKNVRRVISAVLLEGCP
jgi:hypothetical protein